MLRCPGLGGDDKGGGAVVDPRRVARCHRPVLLKRGLQGGERFDGRARPRILILVHADRGSLFLRHIDGNDLVAERAVAHCLLGAPLAFGSEGVLLGAADPILGCDRLRRVAHVTPFNGAAQALGEHRIDYFAVAHPISPARAFQEVWSVAHRLGAAGDDDIDETGAHALDGMDHRGEARSAHTVDGFGGHLVRKAGLDCGLTGDVHARAGLKHAAEDDLTHSVVGDRRARDRVADDDGAEVGSGEVLECAAEGPDGRAAGREKYCG